MTLKSKEIKRLVEIFVSLIVIWTKRMQKTIKWKTLLNIKNRYIKIDIVFWATKALIPNDTDPLCEQFWNP